MISKLIFVSILGILPLYEALVDIQKFSALKGESLISYSLSHPLHKIEATSKEFICEIEATDSKEIKSVKVVVDVMTFDSGNSSRDSHAMEVIDALSFPEVSFISQSVLVVDDTLRVKGNLSFHGETKQIEYTAQKTMSGGKTRVNGKITVKLADFKVERPQLALIPVDESLYISFSVVFAL